MKTDGSDWLPREKSESEKIFDSILFCRMSASMSVERLRIIKELERLLQEDKTKFAGYLSDMIGLYENECEPVLNITEGDPVPEELRDLYYDKNTTLVQYLYAKRKVILDYLQKLKTLWTKGKAEEITAELKEAHGESVHEAFNAIKRIENDFPLLENLTMTAINDSSDTQKNEKLKESLEKMRNDLRNNGVNV
jgi:hypothetical protein